MSECIKPDYTQLRLAPPKTDRPTILVNMVMSADGKTVIGQTERGLGSPTDQRLMREIRANADVILNGANTLRASGTSSSIDHKELKKLRDAQGKNSPPISAVLSRSGNLPLHRAFFQSSEFKAIVYLADTVRMDRKNRLQATGRKIHIVPSDNTILATIHHMRSELKANVLLVEGGPTINNEFFKRDLVDHYFLTLAPIIVGSHETISGIETRPSWAPNQVRRLTLVAAQPNAKTGEVYLHYQRLETTK